MRAYLILLLCFIVAFQVSGNVRALELPCPMNHAGGQTDAVSESVHMARDCCNDAETAAKTGKLCKAEIPCSGSSAGLPPSRHEPQSTAQVSDLVSALTTQITPFNPADIWRPPSFS